MLTYHKCGDRGSHIRGFAAQAAEGYQPQEQASSSHAKRGDSIIAVMEVIGGAGSVCVERFEDYPRWVVSLCVTR